jgi:putative transposase
VVQPRPSLYKRHRFPGEVISHAVWLYYRFLLSYRDVEDLLAERGIAVSYETVRRWCRKFGRVFADGLRRRRPRPGDKWHCENGDAGGGGHDPKWHWRSAAAGMPSRWSCLLAAAGAPWIALPLA